MCRLDTQNMLGKALPTRGRVARGILDRRGVGEASLAVEVRLLFAVAALVLLVLVRLEAHQCAVVVMLASIIDRSIFICSPSGTESQEGVREPLTVRPMAHRTPLVSSEAGERAVDVDLPETKALRKSGAQTIPSGARRSGKRTRQPYASFHYTSDGSAVSSLSL